VWIDEKAFLDEVKRGGAHFFTRALQSVGHIEEKRRRLVIVGIDRQPGDCFSALLKCFYPSHGKRGLAEPCRSFDYRQPFFCKLRSLAEQALERLTTETDLDAEDAVVPTSKGSGREDALEAKISLNSERISRIAAIAQTSGAKSVVDLGCGEGKLLRELAKQRQLTRIVGMDVSLRSLEWARDRLHLEQLGAKPGPHAALFGPETYVHWSKEVMDMVGPAALADWTDPDAVVGGTLEYHFRCSVASTIYGGSSEVLRSLIAEQLLGLPRSRPKT